VRPEEEEMESKILGGLVCAMIVLGCSATPDGEDVETSESTELGAGVARVRFDAPGRYLIVEVLDDDLVHFELSAKGNGPGVDAPLATSPMVAKTDYPGPSQLSRNGNVVETPEIRVEVAPGSLCVSATDKKRGVELTRICPDRLDEDWKGLTLDPKSMQHVYGLGQEFIAPGNGRRRLDRTDPFARRRRRKRHGLVQRRCRGQHADPGDVRARRGQ